MAKNDALLSYLDEYEKNIEQDNNLNASEKEIIEDKNIDDNPPIKQEPSKKQVKNSTRQSKSKVSKKTNVNNKNSSAKSSNKMLIFNIHDVSEEEKEREAIQAELTKLDELLLTEDNKYAEINNKKSGTIENPRNSSNIDDFLAKSKQIWESKKDVSHTEKVEPRSSEQQTTVNAVADSSIDKFLAETRAEWARSGQTATIPTNSPAPDISTPTIDERRVSYKLDKGASVTDLMQQAETHHHEKWLETYEKAQRSRKDNEQARKLKTGRFRYNKDGELEFLPDVRIDDKSADDLLEVKWI